MNFLTAYFKGTWLTIKKIKLWVFLYFINFVFAILAAIPMSNLLQEKLGKSLASERLLSGFDYAIFRDFVNQHGDEIAVIMQQASLVFAFYFFLSIFLAGGILSILKNHEKRFRFQDFWSGCTVYFWRMLRLTFYFLIVHGFVFAAFSVLIYSAVFQKGFDALDSEAVVINAIKFSLPVYLIIASLFFMVQDYAKIHVIDKNPAWLFFSFWKSFKIAFSHFLKTYPLYLLNVLTFTAIFMAFWYFRFSMKMDNSAVIALGFVVGQSFIFARIGTKLLNLGSATLLYQNIMEKESENETFDNEEPSEDTHSPSETSTLETLDESSDEEE